VALVPFFQCVDHLHLPPLATRYVSVSEAHLTAFSVSLIAVASFRVSQLTL